MNKDQSVEDAKRIAEELRKPMYGYCAVRVLADGTICATHDLMYTRAVLIDCDNYGYSRRFCFKSAEKADEEFAKLRTGDDTPTGFVASRDPRNPLR